MNLNRGLAPLVIAHRGASHDAPENTIAAFTLAQQMGADAIELDTSLSRDGVPVVMHDFKIDRTTDGTGKITDYDLQTLKTFDSGIKFSPDFKGQTIPTLDEAFEAIPKLLVHVELKSYSLRPDGLEPAVLDVIKRHNAANRVLVSSFNPFAVRRFRALASEIPIGFATAPQEPIFLRDGWLMLRCPHDAKHPNHETVDSLYMAWAKQHNYLVNTWTVDDPDEMVRLRDLGVDGIFTNRPDVMLKALGR